MQTTIVSDIPILWEAPGKTAERKLVIWLPGFTDGKESTRDYLTQLAAVGFYALSLDPVDHGIRSYQADEEELDPTSGRFRDPATGRIYRHFWSIEAETAAEVPTVIDWAIAELGVSSTVGMGGKSMGGDIAVVAAGIDRRIAAVAACIATPDWLKPGSIYKLSAPNAEIQTQYECHNPLTNLDRYQHCPAISFQCAEGDSIVPPDGAVRFAKMLNATYQDCADRLEVVLHDGIEHELTDTMWQNSLHWFTHFL